LQRLKGAHLVVVTDGIPQGSQRRRRIGVRRRKLA
jgi:hypothetical protein